MIDWRSAYIAYLALTIYREARNQTDKCILGVACSIRNRVLNPKWWGNSYFSVLFKKWQYSSLTAVGDSQLLIWPNDNDKAFLKCLDIAEQVIDNKVESPFPGADSYYDISIPAPKWATDDKLVGSDGRIKFYNIDNDHELGTVKIENPTINASSPISNT